MICVYIIFVALQSRQSNSLDWRMGRRINSDWRDTSRSAEHLLSRNSHINVGGLRTPTTKYVEMMFEYKREKRNMKVN